MTASNAKREHFKVKSVNYHFRRQYKSYIFTNFFEQSKNAFFYTYLYWICPLLEDSVQL